MINSKFLVTSIILAGLVTASPALSEELVITDCDGNTQVMNTIEAGQSEQVAIKLAGNANGQIVLTNAATGAVEKTTAKNGEAVFEKVSEGVYSVCVEPSSVSVDEVVVGGSGNGVVVASAVGVGSVAGLALGLSGGGSSSGGSIAATETGTVSGSVVEPSAPVVRDTTIASDTSSSGSSSSGSSAPSVAKKPHPCNTTLTPSEARSREACFTDVEADQKFASEIQ